MFRRNYTLPNLPVFIILQLLFTSCNDPLQPEGAKFYSQLPDGTYKIIEFINADEGWAIDHYGPIYHTTDGGESWTSQDFEPGATFFSIKFIDENHGWLGGTRGLWHTNDGGSSWSKLPIQFELWPFIELAFINSQTAWIAGGLAGSIYHTSDGGNTWDERFIDTPLSIMGLSFVSENLGWATGADSRVYRTVDGGLTWTSSESPRFSQTIFFTDALVGYVGNNVWASSLGDDRANIFKTIDGGNSWVAQQIPLSQSVLNLAFIDANIGVATTSSEAIYTTNGGNDWYSIPDLPTDLAYIDFSILDSGDIYILSYTGEIYQWSIQ